MLIPVDADDSFIMDVQVTTTEDNQRVKIDGRLTVSIAAMFDVTEIMFNLRFDLIRNPSTLLAECFQTGSYSIPTQHPHYNWHPSFIFVDVPGAAGVYTYRVVVTGLFPREGIDFIEAIDLGLTATVYSPA